MCTRRRDGKKNTADLIISHQLPSIATIPNLKQEYASHQIRTLLSMTMPDLVRMLSVFFYPVEAGRKDVMLSPCAYQPGEIKSSEHYYPNRPRSSVVKSAVHPAGSSGSTVPTDDRQPNKIAGRTRLSSCRFAQPQAVENENDEGDEYTERMRGNSGAVLENFTELLCDDLDREEFNMYLAEAY